MENVLTNGKEYGIMTLTLSTQYNNPANFTFDSDDIEVDGAGARLKLQFFPEQDFSEDFADDAGFVYDNTKSEFVSGLVRQKDQTDANQILVAKYGASLDANWNKDGATAAVLVGSPTLGTNEFSCTGDQGISYPLSTNKPQGTLKFIYKPNYTGAPPENIEICAIGEISSSNNQVGLSHSPSGNTLRAWVTDSSGVAILTASTLGSAFLPTAGQEYEFALQWNSAAGFFNVYIDGTLKANLSPGAWTMNSTSLKAVIGSGQLSYNRAEASFSKVTLFDSVQHSSNYTPGYTLLDFIYAETFVMLPIFTYDGPGELEPAGPPSSTESGIPRYIIQGRYWDGATWSASNGSYAQATSKADILAHILTFPSTGLSTITVIVVFGDSNTQSSVDQIDFSVVGQEFSQDNPTIRPNGFTQVDGLLDFDSVEIVSGSDAIKHIIERRSALGGASSYFYWNGSAWVTSNTTYAQSNTKAELATNLASFDLSSGYYIRIVSFLHSDDGYTTPEITSIFFEYDFKVTPSSPNRVIVYGWLINAKKEPLIGTVSIEVVTPFKHSGLIMPNSIVSVSTDQAGYFEFDGDDKIIETETVGKSYRVRINYTNPKAEEVIETIEIPDQESFNLQDRLFLGV